MNCSCFKSLSEKDDLLLYDRLHIILTQIIPVNTQLMVTSSGVTTVPTDPAVRGSPQPRGTHDYWLKKIYSFQYLINRPTLHVKLNLSYIYTYIYIYISGAARGRRVPRQKKKWEKEKRARESEFRGCYKQCQNWRFSHLIKKKLMNGDAFRLPQWL